MNRHFALHVFTIFIVFACSFVVFAEEMRTWTDSSGKFTIEASLVSFENDTVKLKKEDGKILTLAIDKLSEVDKIYLAENDSPANPFEAAERAPSGDSASGDSAPRTSSAKTVDVNNAKEVGDYGETRWSCAPDPAPLDDLASKKISFRPGAIPFHSHPKDSGFFFSHDGQKVLYTLQVPKPMIGEGDESTRIFLADVASGETVMIKNKLCLNSYGLSPDGTKAMFVQIPWERGIDTDGKKGKIIIFKCAADKFEPFTILNPIDSLERLGLGRSRSQETADVEQAVWVSNDHILVFYSSDHTELLLALVNVDTGKALWKLKPNFPAKSVALSPGGKYFLVKSGKATLLVETVSGKTIGTLEGVNGHDAAYYSFSPDGQKIASCGNGGMICLWDATTGQPEEAFFIDGANGYSTFTWVSNQHLMIGNKLIVDTTLQVPVWEYRGNIKDSCYFGGQFWYLAGDKEAKTLVGVKIPQKKVLDQYSGNQNDANLFVVQPGMTVALKMDPSISRDKDEIKRSMEEKLRENGLTLENDAPVVFLLKVTQEGEKPATYTTGPFRMRGGGTDVKFRQEKYELLLQQGNKTLWSCTHVTGPPDVSLDDVAKSSLQSVVNKKVQERHYKDWFLRQDVPKKIPKIDNIGTSTLSEIGLRDN